MRRLLKDIRERFNIPIILVTHDLIETYTMADRIIVYSDGKIVQISSPSEVFTNPATKEVACLVNTENFLKPVYAIHN
jgi:ABC-type Fe3+/spermidine/putrescine transport system ATPase subunit